VWGQNEPSRITLEESMRPFYHGVASGDPLSDRVILWTRVTPEAGHSGPIAVEWEISPNPNFSPVVQSGTVSTDESRDYTVKVDATGLSPRTYYYYRFKALGATSLVGRTKTAPSGYVNHLRFAFASCSNFNDGYFLGYEDIGRRNDLDAVFHLGDYIYEYAASGTNRRHEPDKEIVELEDYRMRYSQYRLDEDLRLAHQQHPFITIWDDHEVANDAYRDGAENHTDSSEGPYEVRKNRALQAYFEWLPVRETGPPARPYRGWRKISYGGLADIFVLDTRIEGRDEQAPRGNLAAMNDTNRTILGEEQRQWLLEALSQSQAQWKIIAQQVMMAPLYAFGAPLNSDQWDGYPGDRNRLLRHIVHNGIQNVVVITGDIHSSWANDVPLDRTNYNASTGAGSAAVEFITPGITSTANALINSVSAVIYASNPYVKFADFARQGYAVLDVTDARVQGEWYFTKSVNVKNYGADFFRGYYCETGTSFLKAATGPAPAPDYDAPFAPVVRDSAVSRTRPGTPIVVAAYPNPFSERISVQFYAPQSGEIHVHLTDANGISVYRSVVSCPSPGLYEHTMYPEPTTSGIYTLTLFDEKNTVSRKIVKK
jgi:alkaline phosphatase D